jgi:uncharacterized protein YwbE
VNQSLNQDITKDFKTDPNFVQEHMNHRDVIGQDMKTDRVDRSTVKYIMTIQSQSRPSSLCVRTNNLLVDLKTSYSRLSNILD